MKKTIAILILLVLTFSVVPVNASDEDEFTQDEAEQLFYDSFRLYMTFQGEFYDTEFVFENRSAWLEFEKSDNVVIEIEGERDKRYDPPIIKSYNTKEGVNFKLETFSDVEELIGLYYSDELIERVLVDSYSDKKISVLYCDTANSKLYYLTGNPQCWPSHIIDKYGSFTVDGDKATLEVYGHVRYGATLLQGVDYYKAPIEFTKTDEGWRVSGGAMLEILSGEINREPYVYQMEDYGDNPNTGDTTVTTAALLATIALAAVITPFALSKKRRVR